MWGGYTPATSHIKTKNDYLSALNDIIANDSNVVSCGTGSYYTSQRSPANTEETVPKSTPVKEEDDEEDEEDEIPSDLTIDHHPHRTCQYTLNYEESDEASTSTGSDETDSKWIINNTCISDLCLNLKSTTLQIVMNANPAQISDILILF